VSLETIKSNVRALHASYGFEKQMKEVVEQLIKACQSQEEQIHELQRELDSLKAGKK